MVIQKDSWPIPPVFDLIRKAGKIDDQEMFRVFNMGIGMIIVVAEKEQTEIMERLEMLGEKAYSIGVVQKKENDQPTVSIV